MTAAARPCRRGRPNCSACRAARLRTGAPADVIVIDRDVPWVLDPRRAEVEVQEHAVRRGAPAGPRRAHHRRRAHRLRIRSEHDERARPLAPILAFVLGYLLGSIPFGIVLTQLAGGPDIRGIGSGNIGATNVLRTGTQGARRRDSARRHAQGHRRGADRASPVRHRRGLAAGLGAFLGHVFPVWLKFKGGKGVATYHRRAARPCLAGAARVRDRSGSRSPRPPAIRRLPR